MARNNDRDRGTKRVIKDDKRRITKKKASPIAEGTFVDYKDINVLRKFMSDRGKIRARRVSGLSTQMQRDIAVAIKTARELALLPYATRTVAERGPRSGRGGGGGRRDGGGRNDGDVKAIDADLDIDIDDIDEAGDEE